MAINRVIRPELLDDLPAADPAARRSRDDLAMINRLMGNFRWVLRTLARHPDLVQSGIVEIGAGDGRLCQLIDAEWPSVTLTGLDLAPRPARLPGRVGWRQGDFFQSLPQIKGGAAIGVMVAHHFPAARLREIGRSLINFRLVCFCEPLRSNFSHVLGLGIRPFIGPVTRHDMHASVDAGFRPGELARKLGLTGWKIKESVDLRGSIRLVAWR